MKKIIIALLTVLLCCSAVFADKDAKEGSAVVGISATFGFDENTKFQLNKAEAYVKGGNAAIKASIGYRYFSDAGLLNSFYIKDSTEAKGEHETGLFADIEYQVSKVFIVTADFGYRLFPVISNNNQYVVSTKDSYKGLMGTVSYLDKGFYANLGTTVKPIKGLTLKTDISTDIKNNELNLTDSTFIANYAYTSDDDTHYVNLLAEVKIYTDKDSDGKLFVTSTKTFGKANYTYKDRYLLSSTGIYFKSYTDKAVEDGLYTQNAAAVLINYLLDDDCPKWLNHMKPTVAVSTWAPKENGELKLAKVTTNATLDVRFFNNRLGFNLASYYNHFVDNEEENYFYTENSINAVVLNKKDFSLAVSYANNILVNKVADKLNVIEAQHTLDNDVRYKSFDLEADVDFKHSQDNDPEKNRILNSFELGYTLPKKIVNKVLLNSARIFSGFNEVYQKQNGEYVRSFSDYAGSNITF